MSKARRSRQGRARRGAEWPGKVGQAVEARYTMVRRGMERQSWQGQIRRAMAWCGKAGEARRGMGRIG